MRFGKISTGVVRSGDIAGPLRKRTDGITSVSEQASLNLQDARELRAAGLTYRQVGRSLKLSGAQIRHIRKALSREKAARTVLGRGGVDVTERDLPVGRSVLPIGLRRILIAAGYRTLGDLSDILADPDFRGFAAIPGIGPHRARLIDRMLAHAGLSPEVEDLKASVRHIFPEFGDDA